MQSTCNNSLYSSLSSDRSSSLSSLNQDYEHFGQMPSRQIVANDSTVSITIHSNLIN